MIVIPARPAPTTLIHTLQGDIEVPVGRSTPGQF